MRPVGVVTDRDITIRAVAAGRNPLEMKARECMTSPAITVDEDASLEQCCSTLEGNQVRRVLVVDGEDRLCGVISQADIAQYAPSDLVGKVVKEVSLPTPS
jgi:CBS domain-containing protein